MVIIGWSCWSLALMVYVLAAARARNDVNSRFPQTARVMVGPGHEAIWIVMSFMVLLPASAFPERAGRSYLFGIAVDALAAIAGLVIIFGARGLHPRSAMLAIERRRNRWKWAILSVVLVQVSLAMVGGPAPV